MKRVGENGRPFTAAERKAIAGLQRVADSWPESLTLFSWSGSLVIFKTDEWQGRDLRGVIDTEMFEAEVGREKQDKADIEAGLDRAEGDG